MEIILAIIISLVTGVTAGIYSGLIVTRVSRFEQLRDEAKRIILSIDYISDGNRVKFKVRRDIADIAFVSSDLIFLGHKAAGDEVWSLFNEVSNMLNSQSTTSENMHKNYPLWQKRCRQLSPNLKIILNLNPWPYKSTL